MAIVKNIRVKEAGINGSYKPTYVDISASGNCFSITSYRSTDPERKAPASQNLLFYYEEARVLLDELAVFIAKIEEDC